METPIYDILDSKQAVVGEIKQAVIQPGDTLESIAYRYRVPYLDLLRANPELDPAVALLAWHPIKIPSQFILPPLPREGIIINLPELKLYYFISDAKVMIIPVGIGREGWTTPLGKTHIRLKLKSPSWTPTQRVREDAEKEGKLLPAVVPPGPDNPLGGYALLLDWKTFLIHGTNHPDGVGKRSSAGCFRLYPEDIAFLYDHVPVDTPVYVINLPVKTGWLENQLFMQAFPTLSDYPEQVDTTELVNSLHLEQDAQYLPISWEQIKALLDEVSGISTLISYKFVVDSKKRS